MTTANNRGLSSDLKHYTHPFYTAFAMALRTCLSGVKPCVWFYEERNPKRLWVKASEGGIGGQARFLNKEYFMLLYLVTSHSEKDTQPYMDVL